jgi:ribosomal protein S21
MLIFKLKSEDSVDSVLKKYKRKMERTGLNKELSKRRYFVKKSKRMFNERKLSLYRQHFRTRTNNKCGQSVIVVPEKIDIPVINQENQS